MRALIGGPLDLTATAIAKIELTAQAFDVRGELPKLMRRRPANNRVAV